MDTPDLTAWMGKPPEKSSLEPRSNDDDDLSASSESNRELSAQASDSTSAEEINYDGTPAKPAPTLSMRDIEHSDDDGDEQDEDEDSLVEVIPDFQHKFFIDVPKLDEQEKDAYKHLPGHFSVQKIVSEFRGDRYLVKLMSGERQMVSLVSHLHHLVHNRFIMVPYGLQTIT